MQTAIPEMNKKPGIYYAVTRDGIELPVIDITNPAFAVEITESELDVLLKEHIRTTQAQGKLSALVQPLLMKLMARRSIIMRGIQGAAGGFMSGMNTYVLKLGPDNLGTGYSGEIDRRIAGSLAGLSMRLRLQDIAHLLADGLTPALGEHAKRALHLLNIGGGPAIDSLNALILLRKKQSGLLARRQITIHSLDLDESGPAFGKRALAALQAEGAPLAGLDIRFERVRYDWSDATVLRKLLISFESGTLVAASSEGALFEYGSDEDITANLQALYEATPANTVVTGSLTRADTTGRIMNGSSRAAVKLRGLEAFTTLIKRAGWTIARSIDRPISHDLSLKKMGRFRRGS